MTGRRKPYTEIGIRRVPCSRCGKPSTAQWKICANGNRYAGVCTDCDIEMNRLILQFMRVPHRGKLLAKYRREAAG